MTRRRAIQHSSQPGTGTSRRTIVSVRQVPHVLPAYACWRVRTRAREKAIVVYGTKDQAIKMARVLAIPFRPCKIMVMPFGGSVEEYDVP